MIAMNSLDLPLIIVNPKSGRGITEQKWASLANVIRTDFGPFACEFTRARGDASRIAEEEAKRGRRLIIAVGGDGTISEVANGILRSGSEAELGILPGGTGGDFRRTLGVSPKLHEAAIALRNGKTHKMDAGRLTCINHQGQSETRFFINTASFGMSGHVAGRVNTSGKSFGGGVTYAIAAMKTFFEYDHPEVILQLDENPPVRLRIVTVCVANGPSFGGGMKIAPGAKLNDGFFNVVTVGDLKTMRFLLNSYKLYTGGVMSIDRVAQMPAKKIEARPAHDGEAIPLEVDGETPGRLPATFEMLPAVLRIRL
jgi:YegS/Rv2252/BmrU family lipid kinase